MTLQEAIDHCEEKAKELREQADKFVLCTGAKADCYKCAEEHEQLGEWLTQLKEIKEAYESDYQIQDVIEVCCMFWG